MKERLLSRVTSGPRGQVNETLKCATKQIGQGSTSTVRR